MTATTTTGCIYRPVRLYSTGWAFLCDWAWPVHVEAAHESVMVIIHTLMHRHDAEIHGPFAFVFLIS